MSNPITWVALMGTAAILSLLGPFGTDQTLGLIHRLLYWIVTVTLTFGFGALSNEIIRHWMSKAPIALIIAVAGCVTGLGICLIVMVINWIVFDFVPPLNEWPTFFGTVMAISYIVTGALYYAGLRRGEAAAPAATATPKPVALLDRIPLEKRGRLVALSVEDHYVRIATTKGTEMVLMRLSDAIRETGDTAGAQVHRSHWIAFAQVRAVRREGDRAILTMSNDSEIPVSRANIAKIKEAGLLPRSQ